MYRSRHTDIVHPLVPKLTCTESYVTHTDGVETPVEAPILLLCGILRRGTLKQEAQLMLTTGSTRLAVSRGQQTWYHSTCYI